MPLLIFLAERRTPSCNSTCSPSLWSQCIADNEIEAAAIVSQGFCSRTALTSEVYVRRETIADLVVRDEENEA